MKKKLLVIFILLFGLFSFAQSSKAQIDSNLLNKMTGNSQSLSNALGITRSVTDSTSIDNYIGSVIGVILSFAGVIFLVLMLIAGYSWITAQGNEETIGKAKQLMTNGIIGLVVSFGTFILINAVISPLASKFFSPVDLTTSGNGNNLVLIPCNSSVQCADQAFRKLCLSGNCLECENNDLANNESNICKNLYTDKPTCDTRSFVCIPSLTAGCSVLNKNTCLAQANCRLEYKPTTSVVEKNNCYNINTDNNRGINNGWCDQFDGAGKQSLCLENSLWCAWEGTVSQTVTTSSCIDKANYACANQCQGSQPFCLSSSNPAKCVECRDDRDCAGNLLAKKCSISTGNYVCVPF